MLKNLTWRNASRYLISILIVIIFLDFAYTVYLWWIDDPTEFEPLVMLKNDVILPVLVLFYGWLIHPQTPNKSITQLPHHAPSSTLGESNWQRNRQNVLHNMQSTVDDYLRHTVYEEVYLLLGMEYEQDALLRRPLNCESYPQQMPVPDDKSIYNLYIEHGRNLLILGEPASGKTITLLQLTDVLILDAQTDDNAPIPIIVNLSSWSLKRPILNDWLVEEFLLQYQIARSLTREWLTQNQFILLLDGLDEVATEHQNACVDAINGFRAESTISVVVCSRTMDYEKLQQRLNLTTAIVLKPLTQTQVDEYLQKFGSRTIGIQQAIHNEPPLQELAQSPLMLSLMPLAYDGVDHQNLASSMTLQAHRRNLFDRYVERVLVRRPFPNEGPYDKQQALAWLINLAKGMQNHDQSIFYIERLHPSWLPGYLQGPNHELLYGLLFFLFGVGLGLPIYIYTIFLSDVIVPGAVLLGVLVAMIYGGAGWGIGISYGDKIVLREIFYWSKPSKSQLRELIDSGLTIALGFGFFSGLLFGLIGGLAGWMTGEFVRGLFLGIASGLTFGLIIWLSIWLIVLLRSSIKERKTNLSRNPNQRIKASFRNGILYFGVFALYGVFFGSVFGGLIGVLFLRPSSVNISLIGCGLAGGLLFGMSLGFLQYGGESFIQHYALRFLLARKNILPYPFRDKRLIAYLDAMAERVLLRRVGGGWIFIHRYLLEYFAEQHPSNQME